MALHCDGIVYYVGLTNGSNRMIKAAKHYRSEMEKNLSKVDITQHLNEIEFKIIDACVCGDSIVAYKVINPKASDAITTELEKLGFTVAEKYIDSIFGHGYYVLFIRF